MDHLQDMELLVVTDLLVGPLGTGPLLQLVTLLTPRLSVTKPMLQLLVMPPPFTDLMLLQLPAMDSTDPQQIMVTVLQHILHMVAMMIMLNLPLTISATSPTTSMEISCPDKRVEMVMEM